MQYKRKNIRQEKRKINIDDIKGFLDNVLLFELIVY